MNILCVDDADIHLTSIKSMLKLIDLGKGPLGEVAEAKDGAKAIGLFKSMSPRPDIVTLDIRMPEMDGLSALILIKALSPRTPVVMVSSEDEKTISRKKGGAAGMPLNEKFALLDKVADRVKKGIKEPGKINLILDACEELGLDPISVAEHFGANGYLKKPYTKDQTERVLGEVIQGANKFVQAS